MTAEFIFLLNAWGGSGFYREPLYLKKEPGDSGSLKRRGK
jgi:hypothetical protein